MACDRRRRNCGQVSIYLPRVQIEDAVKILMDRYDLAYVFDGSEEQILRIMSLENYKLKYGQEYEPRHQSIMIPLIHVTYQDVKDFVEAQLSPDGRLLEKAGPKMVIVIDNKDSVLRIKEHIKKIDHPLEEKSFG